MKHFILLSLALTLQAVATDWTQFRGPQGNGVSTDRNLPAKLSSDNLKWSISLPGRGLSGALVLGNKVILTCSSGPTQTRLHVIALNTRDGSTLWHRQFWATGRTMCHSKTSVAAPTPCSDGKNIYAVFSSNDVICLDLDGNLQWLRGLTADYANVSNSLGMSSSPVVTGNTLVVQVENDSESYTLGLNKNTGINRWRLDRPKAANWTSPLIIAEGLVALQSKEGIDAVRAMDGSKAWSYDDGASTIPSSTLLKGVIYVPSHGVTALELNKDDAGNTPKQLWQSGRLQLGTASPIVINNKVFTINKAGVLTTGDTQSGERGWQLRLKGPFSATPVSAGKHLYFVNERGLIQVVDTETEEGEIVGTLNLDEQILGSPAVGGGALYLRSNTKVYKIAK
ncbi:MAG: PQQ-binding-like beta-propeller repeat protein [Verrucomicrobiota bacterium]|nr:PQQ-binding-like beta-propeller repeat protein [Verrucomicrobiota bacterium]